MASIRQDVSFEFVRARLEADPTLAANAIYREAKAAGLSARRQDVLEQVRSEKARIGAAPRVQAKPERFVPLKFRAARRDPQRDAAAILSLARREYGGRVEPARRLYNSLYPARALGRKQLVKLAGDAVHVKGGTLVAKEFDRLPRHSNVFTTAGVVPLVIRDSRTASLIGRHWAAIGQFLETGDENFLKPFRRKHFRVNKRAYVLETDPNVILEDASTGQLGGLEIGT